MQDTDLPIILEELPNFKLQNIKSKTFEKIDEEVRFQTAYDFITRLQDYITGQKTDKDELYSLYDYEFNSLCRTVFESGTWPAPEDIEAKFSTEDKDIEIDYNTQIFYNELCYRHAFSRFQKSQNFGTIISESWNNYLEIFDIIAKQKNEIPFPSSWIWDIIDEFIYQFQVSCKYRGSISQQDEDMQKLIQEQKSKLGNPNADPIYWNLETVQKLLQKIIDTSEVIKAINGVKQLTQGINQTMTYFGHFAQVGLVRIYVLVGNYEKAVQSIEIINYDSLFTFSKAVPSYLTLFYYAGTAYLMNQKYNEAVNLFQAIVLFFIKYKQFLSKSFQYDNMTKQAEKCLVLLSLSMVFYPTPIEDVIQQKMQETIIKKMYNDANQKQETLADKFRKLEHFHISAFNDVFNNGFPKPINVIQDTNDFINMGFDNEKRDIPRPRERLEKEFQNITYLNNISSYLKIYSNVPCSKLALLLKVNESDLNKYLQAYKQRSQSSIRKEVPFEQTVLQRFLLNGQNQLDFKVQDNIIYVTEVAPARNYIEYFSNLNTKLVQLESEISKIGNI